MTEIILKGKMPAFNIFSFSIMFSKILSFSTEVEWFIILLLQNNPVFNSLPKDKILDWSKLKAFADKKINVAKKLKIVLGRVENIVGKGENAGNQHFLIFPQYFQ